jgi:hypothetical protein|tara:strand:+ start:2467 stop:2868 length:402 start_codon:yes stop_codon:yes gene_type:complete
MFEKDYLMRLLQTLLDAINNIINSINKKDIEGAKKQINDIFRLLGDTEEYFLNTDYEELIAFFKLKDGNYLESVQLLAELLYLDFTIEKDDHRRKSKIIKSQKLFKHYIEYSKEYSFEINKKLILINKELDKL